MSTALIEILGTLLVFVLGLSFGSFLNVIIERVPREKTIKGRSSCPKCSHELGLADLLPLLSFVLLRLKCRYCQSPISWQYPAVEFFTGLLFVLVFRSFPLPYSVFYIILFSVLFVLFAVDLKFGVVPMVIVYPAIIFTILARILIPLSESLELYRRLAFDKTGFGRYLLKAGFFSTHLILQFQPVFLTLLGSLVIALIFLLLVLITRGRGMGSGDIFYAFLVSLVTGFPNMFTAIFLAFLSGAVVSLMLVALGKRKFGQTVPLGPFLSLGAFITVFWGGYIVDWYLSLLR